MNVQNTCQLKYIPIKMNADIFANLRFNYCIDIGEFSQYLNMQIWYLYIRRNKKVIALITDLSAHNWTFQN